MRACYFAVGSDTLNSGVFQKIFATATIWRELGCETLVSIGARAGSPATREYSPSKFPFESTLWTWRTGAARAISEFKAARRILAWRPDVVFLRNFWFTPGIIPLLKGVPCVLEINTAEDNESRKFGLVRYACHRFSSSFVMPRAAGFIMVTEEIAQQPIYQRAGKPLAVIANGIRLPRAGAPPPSRETKPVLIMLATSDFFWHGLDKLAPLAKRFADWSIEIVGTLARPESLRDCPNVHFHGFLPPDQFRPLLARAHVGIGTLAMHRKGMTEGSVLKTREYLAAGLPVILGYHDTDFPGERDFLLQIGNHESNVVDSIEAIGEFVRGWQGRRVNPADITCIDIVAKERARLKFFSQITGVQVPLHPTP